MQVNLATFVLSLSPAMESRGLVWFYFLNRVQIPLYCVTTSDKPHPDLPSGMAPGRVSAGNPNPNPVLEGGRPPVYPVNSCWAPALPGCDFSGMQSRGIHAVCIFLFSWTIHRPAMDSGLSCELSSPLKVLSMWKWRFEGLWTSLPTAPWIQQCLALNSTTQQTLPTLPHTEAAA